ncbi:penicillin-binding protein activator [Neptuniibacter sp. CAU 1671]|uniref:penicillin-binding protein activator n=1 Tax=Neptuniibacter sp. CAU 1671 TaxID=3032593 RepID=UPI0023DC3A3F|nr:penicillin-binding protein activator [Neptuniibacter sp. CAU 1671]MDF2181529.1 penicillin-binding protein activator [Neptuniibacter sp. CAU 1671]
MKFSHQLSLLTLCVLLLTACSSPLPRTPATPLTPTEQAEALLQKAASAKPIRAAELKIEAANLLLTSGEKQRAVEILDQIDLAVLTPSLRFDIAKLKARSALEQNNARQALTYLDQIPEAAGQDYPLNQAIEYRELRAEAYQQQNDPLSEVRELIKISLLTGTPEEQQPLHDRIWTLLHQLSPDTLRQLIQSGSNSYYEQGWLELAQSLLSNNALDSQNEAFQRWKTLWADHPANTLPPKQIGNMSTAPLVVKKLAILLPNSGPLSTPANAIKEGILQAHFRDGSLNKPELVFLDSSQINSTFQLAPLLTTLNIDLVIGPLDKEYVIQLANQGSLDKPMLALNYTEGPSSNLLYQFGLSAEDEARQAADKMWQDGMRQVASITPDTDWGRRIAVAFAQQFTELGGSVIVQTHMGGQETFAGNVASLLKTDASQARFKAIKQRLPGLDIEFEEHRRTDIDAIFMTALPNDARQIKPILAFNFAGDLPIYASSHVYSGSQNPVLDQDLNGIRFCASPWAVQAPSQDKILLTQQRTNVESRFGRLYALGLDAYHLYPYLNQLQALPGTQIQGETGQLSINGRGEVVRTLLWARFRDGIPQLLDQ